MLNRAEFFGSEEWADFRQAVEERIGSRTRELLGWAPMPGLDAATNLTTVVGILREVATMRWLVQDLPVQLTDEERATYARGEGGASGEEDEPGGELSGAERYLPETEG